MSFIETPRFPKCPSFGYTSTPKYSVTITRTISGAERRNRNWSRPLLRFDCTVGPRGEEDVQEILEFWHAMGGPEVGFRFRDYLDYKTVRVHQSITPFDQLLDPITPTTFQLVKGYTVGARTQLRKIHKPVSGTIRVSENGVEITQGLDWNLNYATGLLTIVGTPAGPIRWGGEFDVPVRFDSEFPVELMDSKIESVQFALTEIRDPFVET
jgi:uncharacterized protein (TIGR02217 family)